MDFLKKVLKKCKLFVIYWTRIVFVKNNFKVNFFTKLKVNILGGFLADQYILYDLRNNDKKLFLSEFDWYKSRYINEPFDFVFNNKVVCSEVLKQYIRVAEIYFIKNKGILYDFSSGVKNYEDIYDCLRNKKNLIIKPFALGKGNGVHLINYKDDCIKIDGEEISEKELFDFFNKQKEYIICEYIKQHKYADEIYENTANTIRLITLRDIETHKFKIFFAVQRMGTSHTIPVDNGSKGGLISKIDIETGRLSEAKCLYSMDTYCVHPDSKKKFTEIVIPEWDKIKSEILHVSNKLPYMDFIAWDILMTEEGICVIEANTSSGVNIIQLWGGQRQGELGKFYKKYNVIK